MANQNNNPYLNPIKWHELNHVQAQQYLSKFMDDYGFKDTIAWYQEDMCFFQRWGINDALRMQFKANFQPITLKIFKADGTFVTDHVLDQKQQDFFNPDFYLYQSDYDFAALPYGYYQFQLHFGGPTSLVLVAEPQIIQADADLKDDTLYIEYSHYEKRGGLYFNAPTNPFSPSIRIPGRLRYKEPGSRDTWIEDEALNPTMVQSLNFDTFTLIAGVSKERPGIPPWYIQKLNRIIRCSDVKIDGRFWTVAVENASWQPFEEEGYPLKGWSIDLRPKLNKDGTDYTTSVAQIGINSIMSVSDTKGFGIDDNGGDFLEFEDVK